jgi:hypothetical protein
MIVVSKRNVSRITDFDEFFLDISIAKAGHKTAFNRFARIQNDVKTLCVQDLSVQFVYKSKTDWE